jgi:hypothetical protein
VSRSALPMVETSDVTGRRQASAGISVRSGSLDQAAVGLLSFAAVALVAAAEGGYFPPSWGWATVGASVLIIVVLALRPHIDLAALDVVLLGGLAAFAAWIAASIMWTRTVPQSVLETERALVYVTAVAAALFLLKRRSVPYLLGGLLAAVVTIGGYALVTRLFPARFENFHPIAGYRLMGSLGYWNALGIFVAVGSLLALGFAARARLFAVRAVSAVGLVVLVPTLYFTYSRGAWVALGGGLLVALALDARRLQLLATVLALAPAPAIAVAVGARSRGLTHTDTSIEVATRQGHRLALLLLPLAALAAVSTLVLATLERRTSIPARAQRAIGIATAAVALVAATAVVANFGGPAALVDRAAEEFASPPSNDPNLNARLFSFSGTGRNAQYRVAWDAFGERPLVGSGAGTYEHHWLLERPVGNKVRDAHNLYLETLAELGVVGLILLATALLGPLVAAFAARRQPLMPAAAGAYFAYLLHAGVDWDWEMPAVTLAALACGLALVVSARRDRGRLVGPSARVGLSAAALVIGAFAFVGLVGNTEIERAGAAIQARDFRAAEAPARKSITWAPWSADGWRRLGQAQLGIEQNEAARRNLRKAVSKDPLNWDRWFDLALATRGEERRRALQRALELNPRSPELAEYIRTVGLAGFDVGGR